MCTYARKCVRGTRANERLCVHGKPPETQLCERGTPAHAQNSVLGTIRVNDILFCNLTRQACLLQYMYPLLQVVLFTLK